MNISKVVVAILGSAFISSAFAFGAGDDNRPGLGQTEIPAAKVVNKIRDNAPDVGRPGHPVVEHMQNRPGADGAGVKPRDVGTFHGEAVNARGDRVYVRGIKGDKATAVIMKKTPAGPDLGGNRPNIRQ